MVHVEMRRGKKGSQQTRVSVYFICWKINFKCVSSLYLSVRIITGTWQPLSEAHMWIKFQRNVSPYSKIETNVVRETKRSLCYAGCVHWGKKLPYWKDWLEFIDVFFIFPLFTESTFLDKIMTIQLTKSWCESRMRMCDSTWTEQTF